LAAIQKVAVLPFETLAQESTSAEKVQKIFYLELLALEVFEVVEPGQVKKSLRGSTEALGPDDFQRLGKELGVDALFLGTVVDFAETRSGSTPAPEVTVQLRLVETATGATVWSTGESRSGASMSTRLFGVGGDSLTEAARQLIRSQLQTLLR
jgi:TolB-like protein